MDPATALAVYLIATNCASREAVQQLLQGKYGEKPVAQAVDSNGNLMQVYANPTTKTYTVVTTTPGGLSCMINGGFEYREEKPTI